MTASLKDTGCRPQAHGQATPGGGGCPRCGRPRCCATAKTRDGERCRKNPHPGATICTNHGLTVAGRAAAADRVKQAGAAKVLAALWPEQVDPVTDPVEALQVLAGRLRHVVEQIGSILEDGDLDGPRGRAWFNAVHELRLLLDGMARLGIAERHVVLEQEKANVIVAAFMASLDVGQLVPEVRSLMVERFTTGLASIVPGEVVA